MLSRATHATASIDCAHMRAGASGAGADVARGCRQWATTPGRQFVRATGALALADRTLAAARLNGNPYWVAWSLWGYGLALTKTDPARALNARRQGLIYSREHRLPFWEHLNAIDTASFEAIHGEVGRGLELLDTVVDAFHRSGDVRSLARSIDVLVVSPDHLGRSASAATIYGIGSRTLGGAPRLAKVTNRLRDALGAQRFDECVASGAAMQPIESVRYAREQIALVLAELAAAGDLP